MRIKDTNKDENNVGISNNKQITYEKWAWVEHILS